MSSTITVQLDALEALAGELTALAGELSDDAERCSSAAGALHAGLSGDEGLTATCAATAWSALTSALADATRAVAATLVAAVTAYRAAEATRAEQHRATSSRVRGGGLVTAPPGVDPGTLARLRLVATWDGALVHGAQRTLADVLDRLSTWRARLEGLGRALGEAECWSGPAADAAATTVVDLSRVAAAVQSALGRSQEGWDALSVHARAAQELAEQALALAEPGAVGWPPPHPAGGPAAALMAGSVAWSDPLLPVVSVADDALIRAAAAGAAARAAADGVAGLTGLDPGAAAPTVPVLLARLGPLQVPAVPDGLGASDAAAWWASLPAGAQEVLVATAPAAIGSLDGVPAWARDRANRLVLQRALGDPSLPEDAARTARLLAARIEAEEVAGRTVQVHQLDLAGNRVVLAFGDLDTADAVALLVPGVRTTPDDDLGALVGDAHAVAAAATAAAPAVTVATVVWLGYRTPQTLPSMLGRATARLGGRALAAALDGLAAARTAAGRHPGADDRPRAQLRHRRRRRGRGPAGSVGRRGRRPAR